MKQPLLEIRHADELQQTLDAWRNAGETIAFVPTMGHLHEGHLRLVELALAKADRCVVSIFVNPTQFGPNEDLDDYPRSEARDCEVLAARGADAVFLPSVDEIYGDEVKSSLQVPDRIQNTLCGRNRPGHFNGVATVVAKLFALVQPDIAVFGNKDYQQVAVIRWLIETLNLNITLLAAPIVRDNDGLAMSSRNDYLSEDERRRAPELHATLQSIVSALQAGRRDFDGLCNEARLSLTNRGWRVDYIEILHPDLTPPLEQSHEFRVFAAAYLGKPRLIDNLRCVV